MNRSLKKDLHRLLRKEFLHTGLVYLVAVSLLGFGFSYIQQNYILPPEVIRFSSILVLFILGLGVFLGIQLYRRTKDYMSTYEKLLDAVSLPIIYLDRESHPMFANAKMWEYQQGGMFEDLQKSRNWHVDTVHYNGKKYNAYFSNGSTVLVQDEYTLSDQWGHEVGCITVYHDITGYHQLLSLKDGVVAHVDELYTQFEDITADILHAITELSANTSGQAIALRELVSQLQQALNNGSPNGGPLSLQNGTTEAMRSSADRNATVTQELKESIDKLSKLQGEVYKTLSTLQGKYGYSSQHIGKEGLGGGMAPEWPAGR